MFPVVIGTVSNTSRRGITLWALLLSLALHVILFVILAAAKFSRPSLPPSPVVAPTVSLEQIRNLNESSPIIPKPKIKKRLLTSRKFNPQEFPMRSPLEIKEKPSQLLPKTIAASSTDTLVAGNLRLPRTEFFGSFTEHRKICYVVDCSGSMQGLFGQVRKQLKNSIDQLHPDEYFSIVFFRGDQLIELGNGQLLRATGKVKSMAYDLIDAVDLGGKTNALNALIRAMQIHDESGKSAQLIYFLTDGFDLDTDSAKKYISQVENFRKKLASTTKINTIGIWTRLADREILREIASQSGGEFVNIE